MLLCCWSDVGSCFRIYYYLLKRQLPDHCVYRLLPSPSHACCIAFISISIPKEELSNLHAVFADS